MRLRRPDPHAGSCLPVSLFVSGLLLLSLTRAFAEQPASGQPGKEALLRPVTPACVSSPFGPRVLPDRPLAGTFHNGIDLPAPAGAPVRAIAPGVVLRVQRHGRGGLEVLVQHPGFVGIYSHFGSVAPPIAEGQRIVHGGDELGVVGRSGVTYGTHLFFGMIIQGRPVDPAPYLEIARCSGLQRTRGEVAAELDANGRVRPTRIYVLMP